MVTASEDIHDRARAIQAGAAGVLEKTAPVSEIIDCVRRLGAGETIVPPDQIIELLRLAGDYQSHSYDAQLLLMRLTQREREVLQSLGEGMSDKGIAQHLGVSNKTVRVHMANILDKLGVESRLQALIFAVRHGAIEIRSRGN